MPGPSPAFLQQLYAGVTGPVVDMGDVDMPPAMPPPPPAPPPGADMFGMPPAPPPPRQMQSFDRAPIDMGDVDAPPGAPPPDT